MRHILGTSAMAVILASGASAGLAQAQPCGTGPIDLNADGTISADEQQAYQLGTYNGIDYNGDGFVSREEYCFDPAMVEPAAGPPERTLDNDTMPADMQASRTVDQFHLFDENGDRKISREEWTGLEDSQNASLGAQGDYFDSLDDDLDGHLTLREFAEGRGVSYDRARRADQAS